jgi:hypothetical protein
MKIHKHKQRANAVRRAQGVSTKPTKTTYTTLRQIFQYIPEGLPERLAREAGADIRKFSCTSHVAALLCGHLTRASSLNEICDAGRLHEGDYPSPPSGATGNNTCRYHRRATSPACVYAPRAACSSKPISRSTRLRRKPASTMSSISPAASETS